LIVNSSSQGLHHIYGVVKVKTLVGESSGYVAFSITAIWHPAFSAVE
jgi:hypothetical protein